MKVTVACVGVGVLALAFPGCMPDFDGLSAGKSPTTCTGAACGGSGGVATGGGGASNGGGFAGSNTIAGTSSGVAGTVGTAGEGGTADEGGAAGESTGGTGGTGGASGGTGGTGTAGSGGKAGSAGSAGSGGAPCATTFAGGTVLYSFDKAGSAASGVLLYPEDPTGSGPGVCMGPIASSATAFNATEGHTCPGALQLTAPFGAYVSLNQITVALNFASADWTAYSLLHAWMKVLTPDATVAGTETLSYLSQLQFSVASSSKGKGTNTYDGYTSSTKPMSTFADRGWHEITLGLVASSSYYQNAVLNIGIQIQSVGAKPSTPADAPAAPPTTVVEIDDIWLE